MDEEFVSTSQGYLPLSEAKEKGLWITKNICLNCRQKFLVTANAFNPAICYVCWSNRKNK